MTDEQLNLPSVMSTGQDNFFQGDTRQGIEKMRARLLDFKMSNPLLNFPDKTSRLMLRVVDELPEILFQKLRQGTTLTFRPVPEPTRDETELLSLDDFFGQPEIYLEQDKELEVVTTLTQTAPRKNSAPLHARRLGINTSFDLR